jgi:hypothetical protein
MKYGDPYYDGPIPNTGETIEELERDIETEKERLESMSDEEWKAEMRKKYPLEAQLIN